MSANKIFVANWKMNLTAAAGVNLVKSLLPVLSAKLTTEVVVCPSFPALPATAEAISNTSLKLGAQDLSWLDKGNLTGEVSAAMLKEWGVEYVIVGHSERRQQLGEDDSIINQKMQQALRSGLVPMLCVGESFVDKQQGRRDFVIAGQVESALKDIVLQGKEIIIAYEPIWAIGSGQPVKPLAAEQAARVIKQVLIDLYPGLNVKASARILYGGSVAAENILSFVKTDLLNGVLVATASLAIDEFSAMLKKIN